MKQKSKKLIILFIISLVMILCFATIVKAATLSLSKTALELEVGKTETLTCTGAEENATINWASSDTSIATIDSTGKVTAVKEGTATITATAGEDTATCAVTIKATSTSEEVENVQWTDFSKAEYEVVKNGVSGVNLNIKNVNIVKESKIYYCITSTNDKPKMEFNDDGYLNEQEMWDLLVTDNSGVLKGEIQKYVQLNQDLYLWVYEQKHLENAYRDDYGKGIYYIGKLLSSGQKLTRPKYPVYAELFFATYMSNDSTQIVTTIPYEWYTERKFTLKIGKITDNNILNGIKNNNGDSWNSLLEYAKNSNAIFNNKLTTNKVHASFAEYNTNDKDEKKDVIQLNNLEDKAYYYMYVVFDDENGKYYPASGLTIAKADVFTTGEYKGEWHLHFLGNDKFKWDDFGTTQTGTATVDGNTTGTISNSPSRLPYTGATTIGLTIVIIAGFAVFFKVKNNKYKGI